LPPSMLVSTKIVSAYMTVMVAGLEPHLEVMLPPTARAAWNATLVQLPAVPVPTTASARTGRGYNATAASSTASVRATTARITGTVYPASAAKVKATQAACGGATEIRPVAGSPFARPRCAVAAAFAPLAQLRREGPRIAGAGASGNYVVATAAHLSSAYPRAKLHVDAAGGKSARERVTTDAS
jgi:hypothetical protein